MISLELARAILDRDITYIDENKLHKTLTFYTDKGSFIGEYNIYEVSNMIKDFIFNHGYEVVSYRMQDMEGFDEYRCLFAHTSINLNKDKRTGFYGITELQSISKAGQWILDNKDKQ